MEAEVLLIGSWKNIEELEENVSLPELEKLVDAGRKKEHRYFRFMGLMKGVDIDEGQDNKQRFEEIKQRAEAKRRGVSEEQLALENLGIGVETE